MPVYIRKNVSYTPPSIGRMSPEEDDDYLLDPDQLIDVLPQPYRMINKVLVKIFEDAWDIIEHKQNLRLAEERKVKPPKYDAPNKLPVSEKIDQERIDHEHFFNHFKLDKINPALKLQRTGTGR